MSQPLGTFDGDSGTLVQVVALGIRLATEADPRACLDDVVAIDYGIAQAAASLDHHIVHDHASVDLHIFLDHDLAPYHRIS